jgi:hypothetical protein
VTVRARTCFGLLALAAILPLAAGCGCGREPAPAPAPPPGVVTLTGPGLGADGRSDEGKVRAADYSILFVGNSHTMSHSLPNLVCDMIRFRHPGKTTYAHVIGVGFLEDTARNPACREEIESRSWKFVVLQAQKISVSGKHAYSRKEGIEIARLAKAHGASVHFFCEWGLRGVPDNGPRQEKVYSEMAAEAGVKVAPVNRAWDIALAERPELPLYEADGNHQSATGTFLTAAFLYAKLTGESPAPLAAFPFAEVSDADRAFLAESATKAAIP